VAIEIERRKSRVQMGQKLRQLFKEKKRKNEGRKENTHKPQTKLFK